MSAKSRTRAMSRRTTVVGASDLIRLEKFSSISLACEELERWTIEALASGRYQYSDLGGVIDGADVTRVIVRLATRQYLVRQAQEAEAPELVTAFERACRQVTGDLVVIVHDDRKGHAVTLTALRARLVDMIEEKRNGR